MADYITLLQQFNISPTAAKVYLALLELGKSSADKIAKRAETYKANVYQALEKLAEVGLANRYLNSLIKKKLIVRKGVGRGVRYERE